MSSFTSLGSVLAPSGMDDKAKQEEVKVSTFGITILIEVIIW